MPRMIDSMISLDPDKYQPIEPLRGGTHAEPQPMPQPAPQLPMHLVQSTVMISSMPSIASGVDGITRQFYASGRIPTRRVTLPG